jgi:transcription elongation factor GreB
MNHRFDAAGFQSSPHGPNQGVVADVTRRKTQLTILGIDEADSLKGQVSWVSPIARALLKSRVGDVVKLQTPKGVQEIEVMQVRYPAPGQV